MRSRTTVAIDRLALERAVRELVDTDMPVRAVRELTDGMFNAAYAVTLDDGSRVVVKVAPPASTPVLTYEHDLMRAEAYFLRRCAGVIAVPALLAVDLSRSVLDRDVLVMQHLEGRPLTAAKRDMSRQDHAAVQGELGALVARLRTVTGTRFGYDRPGGALSADTWRAALSLMVTTLLADAEHYRVRLPAAAHRLPEYVESAASELDAIRTPVLTHFDLWEGNVFVVRRDAGVRLEAVVDGERAFWGDPLAEIVSTSVFRDPRRATDFLAGYAEVVGEPLDLGPDAQVRLALYRAYLFLIMTIEGTPRGYRRVESRLVRSYARYRPVRELRTLNRMLG